MFTNALRARAPRQLAPRTNPPLSNTLVLFDIIESTENEVASLFKRIPVNDVRLFSTAPNDIALRCHRHGKPPSLNRRDSIIRDTTISTCARLQGIESLEHAPYKPRDEIESEYIRSAQQHKVVVNWNAEKVAPSPGFASDAIFRELRLNSASKRRVVKKMHSKEDISNSIIGVVKGVLEVGQNDPFDVEESLISCGVDSISFAQMQGNVLQMPGVEIPVRYLSESFSVNRMLVDVLKGAGSGQCGSTCITCVSRNWTQNDMLVKLLQRVVLIYLRIHGQRKPTTGAGFNFHQVTAFYGVKRPVAATNPAKARPRSGKETVDERKSR
ncbi:hypothetical protein BDQ17DRAFT_1321707 [Cyathus striatus]|nr:hypothetical protein BDQ17DRAFT_1321707 [Cyathus striatus]